MGQITLAKIETQTLYHVTNNTDGNEGRGRTFTVGWFLDLDVATRAGKGRYVMGTDCPVERVTKRVVRDQDGRIYLLGEEIMISYESPEEVRARALAKLTADERKALGL